MFSKEPILIPTVEPEYLERLTYYSGGYLIGNKKTNLTIRYEDVVKYLYNVGARTIQLIIEKNKLQIIKKIKENFKNLIIIAGGGIKSINEGIDYINAGAHYIIVGRNFLNNPKSIPQFINNFGSKLIISVDDNMGTITNYPQLSTVDYCKKLCIYNPPNVLYVNNVFKLKNNGINIKIFKKMRKILPNTRLMYSGGISDLKNITDLIKIGANSIIIGTYAYNHPEVFKEQL